MKEANDGNTNRVGFTTWNGKTISNKYVQYSIS